jgi:glucosamine 6-phosphate synthetase-like amidotransferase/phosphosugar isomerase protein
MAIWQIVALDFITTAIAVFFLYLYFEKQKKKNSEAFTKYLAELDETNNRLKIKIKRQDQKIRKLERLIKKSVKTGLDP